MKQDQYLKLEVCLLTTDGVSQLIDRMGMEGLGIYVALLLKMRQDDELQALCSEPSLAAMARWFNTAPERLREVIDGFGLFVPATNHSDSEKILSPYLVRVMAPLWARRGDRLPTATRRHPVTVKRAANGRFTATPTIEEKSREEQYNNSRKAEAVVALEDEVPPVAIRPWEALVDEMAADRSWMELVGMRSGLGQLYIDRRNEVVDLFRQHIRLYDKGGGLLRLQDAKQYFANYLAAGSRTCQGVRDRLLGSIRQQQADAGVSPYETIVDGRRTYLGRPIPDSAPPRPDEFSVWDEDKEKWTR